jgi:hypothetical protein
MLPHYTLRTVFYSQLRGVAGLGANMAVAHVTHTTVSQRSLLRCYALCGGNARNQKGAAGLQPPSPPNRNLINRDFVDIMISKVLRDLPFSRNQLMTRTSEFLKIN